MPMRIVHISSVHTWKDPRIFFKQCSSLAQKGFDVHLLTPDSSDEKRNGVQLHRVWNYDPAKQKKVFWLSYSVQQSCLKWHEI